MTSLLQHTKSELRADGFFRDDDDIGPQILAMMETFVSYGGHSGALTTIEKFSRLAYHLPLTPLTGEDDEGEVPEGTSGQIQINKRCTRVFKDDEMAWDVRKGRVPIAFPYIPE